MVKLKSRFSANMYDQTEKPGNILPIETQKIIRDRYSKASEIAVGKVTLEIGGGAGFGSKYLSQFSDKLYCLEYSQENIDDMRKLDLGKVDIQRGDAHNTNYSNESFDLVVALAMIYYLSFDEFIKEAHRILKRDGILFFCTSNKDIPGFVASPFTMEYLSVPKIYKKLKKCGFDITCEGAFPHEYGGPFFSLIRSNIKSSLKVLTHLLPNGADLWRVIRTKRLGPHSPLPSTIEEMLPYEGPHTPLNVNEIERTSRIIYVTARKL